MSAGHNVIAFAKDAATPDETTVVRRWTEDDILVAAEDLSVDRTPDGKTKFNNRATGTGVRGPHGLIEVLRFFRAPVAMRDVLPRLKGMANPRVIDWLLDAHLLLNIKEKALFAHGLINSASSPIGRTVDAFSDIKCSTAKESFAVIGAPVDIGGHNNGSKSGPDAVRHCLPCSDAFDERDVTSPQTIPANDEVSKSDIHDLDFHRTVSMADVDVLDVGDVHYEVGESLPQFGDRLTHVVRRVLDLKYRPITIGGDHSITRFVLRAFTERDTDFGIIHFDAHSDLWACGEGVICHANPFVEVLESPRCKALYQIGLRQFLMSEGRGMRDPRIQYVSARDVWRATRPEEVFARLPKDIPYYLTFDIDCMDPVVCPQTGTPVTGGLVYYDVVEIFDWITKNVNLIGADFVEVTNSQMGENQAADITATLLLRLLMGFGTTRDLEAHAFCPQEHPLDVVSRAK